MPAAGLPVIDMAPLLRRDDAAGRRQVAREIEAACRASGFFYVTGHGVSEAVIGALDAASREFFALPEAAKQENAMARGGRAWRGGSEERGGGNECVRKWKSRGSARH